MKISEKLKNLSWNDILQFLIKHRTIIIVSMLSFLFISISCNLLKGKQNEIDKAKLETKMAITKMISYRNSDSLHVAKIAVIQSDREKDFLKIQSQDSMIVFLQQEVKRFKNKLKEGQSSVTVVESNTNISGSSSTNISYPEQSAGVNKLIFPTYSTFKDTEWLKLGIVANKDSIHYDLNVRNKYSVVVGYDKRKPFAEITNYNPYTETKDMRTYSVLMPPKKRIGVGIGVGYGISGTGLSPYIGVGINYNLFYIK